MTWLYDMNGHMSHRMKTLTGFGLLSCLLSALGCSALTGERGPFRDRSFDYLQANSVEPIAEVQTAKEYQLLVPPVGSHPPLQPGAPPTCGQAGFTRCLLAISTQLARV